MAPATKASRKAAAKKAAATRKRNAAKPAASKPKGTTLTVSNNPFDPGAKVAVHEAHAVSAEAGFGREPISDELSTATVKADGTLEISGLNKGTSYALSSPKDGRTQYLVVTP